MSKYLSRTLRAALLGAAAISSALGMAGTARAEFPDKVIHIIVARSAGGGADSLARLIAPEWAKRLNASIVVENIPGAGGAIALTEGFRRPADGYTIVSWSPPSEYVLELQGRLKSGAGSWEMIGATNSDPGAVAVPMDSNFKSMKDLLDASHDTGKRLSVATIGRTTGSALSAMMYESAFGVKWGIVPFDGGGDVTTALLGNHVDFAIRQGGLYDLAGSKLRILAVANDERIKEFPDVPTIKEATGADIAYSAYRGFAVRKDTPPEVVDLLRKTFADAAQSAEIAAKQYAVTGFRYEFLDAARFEKENANQIAIAEKFKQEILGK
jgi:tripartite-type tricarboxylate transporter receptor subunit TctC